MKTLKSRDPGFSDSALCRVCSLALPNCSSAIPGSFFCGLFRCFVLSPSEFSPRVHLVCLVCSSCFFLGLCFSPLAPPLHLLTPPSTAPDLMSTFLSELAAPAAAHLMLGWDDALSARLAALPINRLNPDESVCSRALVLRQRWLPCGRVFFLSRPDPRHLHGTADSEGVRALCKIAESPHFRPFSPLSSLAWRWRLARRFLLRGCRAASADSPHASREEHEKQHAAGQLSASRFLAAHRGTRTNTCA